MPNSDMFGFPRSGMPVLKDEGDRLCLGTLYDRPLKSSGFILDILGANRLAGSLVIAGALSGVTTISASGTATLSGATPLVLSGSNAVLLMTGENASIGTLLSRVNKAYLKNLEITHRPTVSGNPLPLMEDLMQVKNELAAIIQSIQGVPGDTGPQGPTGDTGPQGPTGATGTGLAWVDITWADFEDLTAGEQTDAGTVFNIIPEA